MPPRGLKKGTKRARQYEHINEGELDRGASESRAEEIAARTVNKQRAPAGLATSSTRKRASWASMAARTMNKSQLQRAVDSRK
jgi:hypothetical protein